MMTGGNSSPLNLIKINDKMLNLHSSSSLCQKCVPEFQFQIDAWITQ